MKKMIVGIASQQAIRARALAIARGDRQPRANEPKIWFTDNSISITELKRDPSAVIEAADGEVAILVHNKLSACLVPAVTYARLLKRLENLEMREIVRSRANERRVKIALDEL